ncbi:phosphoribosyl-ATP diphosphatase [Ancylobacter sp. 6x-1]|uniref:Phosphoribosyl-ATP pyrophosphatase n=1 Tax=Ancylobacter crimeensis TaxID=2579147 RepID=A0ABT0DBY8_9HYPH|nr:phosphoribosyl-ATP diphosphatase [Ancylobacter crimeensis]MCK0197476.1 phosphoribosyl-ATP diphosphatase [Ancylobacter crimeensis]
MTHPTDRVTLEDLAATVAERAAGGKPGEKPSYTRTLLEKGVVKCAQKLGEEAVETALAAVQDDSKAVVSEAADLLYHFAVLLHARGIALDDVYAELARRTAQSGLEEKAGRTAR